MEPKYRAVYCSRCDETHIYRTSVVPGCQVFERVKCPKCQIPLEIIRADTGYELVLSRPGDLERVAEESVRNLVEYAHPDGTDVPVEPSGDALAE